MSFKVFISGASNSAEEWKEALEAPPTALPTLDEEQKEAARRFQVSEEEYARGVLAGKLGERRHAQRAEVLGRAVEAILEGLGQEYQLDAILRQGTEFRWVFRIETPQGLRNVAVPLNLADDVIDSGLVDTLEQLKVRILQGVGRQELMRKQ